MINKKVHQFIDDIRPFIFKQSRFHIIFVMIMQVHLSEIAYYGNTLNKVVCLESKTAGGSWWVQQ
jgi:hypothetical protein